MTRLMLLVCFSLAVAAHADEATYPFSAEFPELSESISELARMVIGDYKDDGDREEYLNNLFRLQIIAKEYSDAMGSIQSLRDIRKQTDPAGAAILYLQYEIFAKAKLRQAAGDIPFETAFAEEFATTFDELDDRSAFQAAGSLSYNLEPARRRFEGALGAHKGSARIGLTEAIALVRAFQPYLVYEAILPLTEAALAEDERRRYEIQDDVLITTMDGATLSAVVARPRRFSSPQPAARCQR